MQGKFKKNSILQTAGVRLFPGQIQSPGKCLLHKLSHFHAEVGLQPDSFPFAETLASDGGDAMYMADHHNYLRKAEHLGSSLVGLGEPLQHIGHGRVLGVEFDRDGNLIMCTAGIVSFYSTALAVSLSGAFSCSGPKRSSRMAQ